MALHNPGNWHWVGRDVQRWAKNYFEKELTQIKAENGGVSAWVTRLDSMEGDVDVHQFKGKVITLFDVKLRLEFEGDAPEAAGVMGTIAIPEVAYDTEVSEYQFNIDLHSPEAKKQPVKELVRSAIVPQLRTELPKFGPALAAAHAKKIQHAPDADPATRSTPPETTTASSSAAPTLNTADSTPVASGGGAAAGGPLVNAVPVRTTAEFRTTAAELFTTFTDPQRLAAFTRSPPTVFEGARPGAKFALFGGGVSGEYVALDEPRRIVQRWRLQSWPPGHYSTLTLDFDQDDVDGVTNMRVEWDRVPVGEEKTTEAKWGEYYVRSLKTTFGFGTIL